MTFSLEAKQKLMFEMCNHEDGEIIHRNILTLSYFTFREITTEELIL